MSQILDTSGRRPPLRRRLAVHSALAAARLLAHLPPRRIVSVLRLLRHRATPATFQQVLTARTDVTATSTLCAGTYCLQRSLATTLLCRMRGTWPTWCSGVRTPPFTAHAWVEAEGRPVGEPADIGSFHHLLTVPAPSPRR